MIKGIGKLIGVEVKLGKPFALRATTEVIENAVPGGDIGLDIGKAVLGRLFGKDSDDPVAERLENLSNKDREKLAELLTDILALSEVVTLAKSDDEIDAEEIEAITEAIGELRQETEALLTA